MEVPPLLSPVLSEALRRAHVRPAAVERWLWSLGCWRTRRTLLGRLEDWAVRPEGPPPLAAEVVR